MSNLSENMDVSLFLDQEMLSSLHGLDGGKGIFLDELIEIYVETSPAVLLRLTLALNAGKADQSKLLAHKLKGICGNLGLIKLTSILTRIELSVEEMSSAEWKLLPGELDREHALSITLLHQHWYSQKKKIV